MLQSYITVGEFYLIEYKTKDICYWHPGSLAQFLNLSLKNLRTILFKNGGEIYNNGEFITFKNKMDADRAIEELEPYVIMAELTK